MSSFLFFTRALTPVIWLPSFYFIEEISLLWRGVISTFTLMLPDLALKNVKKNKNTKKTGLGLGGMQFKYVCLNVLFVGFFCHQGET